MPRHLRPGPWLRPVLLGLAALLFSFTVLRPAPAEQVGRYYQQRLTGLHAALLRLQQVARRAKVAELQTHFAACRQEYKQLEFVVEYYYPSTAQRLNGAALPEAEPSEPELIVPPTGFQVLEAYVYGDEPLDAATRDLVLQEVDNLLYHTRYLQQRAPQLTFTDAETFDAVRLNLYRLAAKGVSGFDSPTARRSLPEAAATLESVAAVAACYDAPAALRQQLQRGVAFLQRPGQRFDDFDRAAFFSRHFSPILAGWRATQVERNIPVLAARRAVRPGAASFFAAEAFDAQFFAPADAAAPTPAVLALGAALFQEPLLSGTGGRSCASCHQPAQAYTDGLKVNLSLGAGGTLERNTPTLLGAALQPEQFADGRVHFLEDQVHAVVSNKAEMGGQLSQAPALLRKAGYTKRFARAFAGEKSPLTERNIRRAVAAYVRSLTSLNSRFDQFLRGDTTVLSAQEVRGFNLFMGKAQCGTCHYLPLFNGAVPPLYDKVENEVLGVPATADTLHPQLDADQGKYRLHRIPYQQSAFKTPTVRNAARTAPYMHNGVYQTLEEVVDFYNRGGGQGLGLSVPTQTLAPDRLELSAAEKQALVAFIKALDDGPASY